MAYFLSRCDPDITGSMKVPPRSLAGGGMTSAALRHGIRGRGLPCDTQMANRPSLYDATAIPPLTKRLTRRASAKKFSNSYPTSFMRLLVISGLHPDLLNIR